LAEVEGELLIAGLSALLMEKSLSAHDPIAGLEVLKVIKISCSARVGTPYSAVIFLVGILMTLSRLLVDAAPSFFHLHH
jgi:hypothetical protein